LAIQREHLDQLDSVNLNSSHSKIIVRDDGSTAPKT